MAFTQTFFSWICVLNVNKLLHIFIVWAKITSELNISPAFKCWLLFMFQAAGISPVSLKRTGKEQFLQSKLFY